MDFFGRIRERIGAVIATVIGSIVLLGCGLLFILFLAPRQKLEARRIEKMPIMDANIVESMKPGEDVLFTGRLQNNPEIVEGQKFIAYTLEVWDVTVPEYDPENPDGEPSGDWDLIEEQFPDLIINVDGKEVKVLSTNLVTINGPIHEILLSSDRGEQAKYDGEWLREGSQRYWGFYNGDLITVLGQKAASGGVVPDEYFAGDRVSFVESKHEAAKFMLIAGVAMIVCSPVALVGGVLTAAFGRRRR